MRLLQECCGEGHKHYVVNSESLAGVCVRHNDDCNAVCVPAKQDPTKRRVCTKANLTQTTLPLTRCTWKGCNRIVKVPKVNATKEEADETMYAGHSSPIPQPPLAPMQKFLYRGPLATPCGAEHFWRK